MDINLLLDEVKLKLDVKSDYQLAKELEIPLPDVYAYRKGKQVPDVYACFKFAEVLGKAPSVVLAQVQAEKAKSEHKRLYFKRFFSIAALWITLGVGSLSYSTPTEAGYEAGSRASLHNSPLCEILLRLRRWFKYDKFVAYFTCNWHVKFAH